MPSRKQDYLSFLPPELLLMIISRVPINNFLDITQTSQALRYFMKENGRRLCNDAIRRQFARRALFLMDSAYIEGWLAPTNNRASEDISQAQSSLRHFDLSIKLTEPGPQYMYWLSKKLVRGWHARNGRANTRVFITETAYFLKGINGMLDTHPQGDTAQDTGNPRHKEMLWYYSAPQIREN